MSKSHLMLFGEFLDLIVVLCIHGDTVQDMAGPRCDWPPLVWLAGTCGREAWHSVLGKAEPACKTVSWDP